MSKKPRLVYAEGQTCFWSRDGRIFSSLSDLKQGLTSMDAATYAHHVTKEKNDFADWVGHVLLDQKCAGAIRKAKTQKTALAAVTKSLGAYAIA